MNAPATRKRHHPGRKYPPNCIVSRQSSSHLAKPRFNTDQAVKIFIEETETAKDLDRLAEESVVAELLIVDTKGDLFIVEALRHFGGIDQVATAFTLRGKQFGCRFEIRSSKFKA